MQCINPIQLGGSFYPCGNCIPCRVNKRSNWALRIFLESKSHKYCSFITLTYNDKNIPISSKKCYTLNKTDLQLFIKRFRKNTGAKIRYFASGEYGDNFNRPHYHIIMFSGSSSICNRDIVQNCWAKGFVVVSRTVNLTRMAYVAKYTCKKLNGSLAYNAYEKNDIEPEFALMSRRPGIGFFEIEKNKKELRNSKNIKLNGKKYPISRFIYNKIFSRDERQKLLIEKNIFSEYQFYEAYRNQNKITDIYKFHDFLYKQKVDELNRKKITDPIIRYKTISTLLKIKHNISLSEPKEIKKGGEKNGKD